MTATTEKLTNASRSLVDADIQLKDIIKTLPRECFQKNSRKAWLSVLLSVTAVILGYTSIVFSPWFLLPFAWFFTGTALTGFFVIAHDCGHRSFAKRRWVNDLVGHVLMLPLIYPFHCWRILHDHHHIHTNKLDIDNAWHPWTPETYAAETPVISKSYELLRGRFWWVASVAHWAVLHFDLSNFSKRDQGKAKLSIAAVLIFAAIVFPTLIITTGVWGFVKFWLMPWLGYHFWMSTFTLVHHTAPDIPFYLENEWSAAESQLAGTVHCSYPRWVEILCHDINVHIPHHVSVAIPSYNLRMAHHKLKETWGAHMIERKFSWPLMREIVDQCHIYDPETIYISFKDLKRKSA
ncbi:fatty acid desaturase [Geitlerinema sp. PCC 7407]|uniref:fatty acid desaturase n=1 Tax=Geitlerinema sp. PCC 7407 TaxID=1173025 RepID=UPI00029FCCA9|nr:fatty acid desaturase [Geitlerinema sp. PCC 7407]AFY67009.1 Delta-12 acyl-phospholipid desaturase [Geitlerinema sp. PCC 7407]